MLNPDFREFIQSFNDNRVLYLVVGGYAVALHGHPPYTKDMDVWVALEADNAASIVKALDQYRIRLPRAAGVGFSCARSDHPTGISAKSHKHTDHPPRC